MKIENLSLSRRKNLSAMLLVAPMVAFTLLFIVGPLLYLVVLSFATRAEGIGVQAVFTLDNYLTIFREPVYRKVFFDSFRLAFLTTLLVALLGYPFGYFMANLSARWKVRIGTMLMVPFWVSSLLRLYGWKILLRDGGFFSSLPKWLGFSKDPIIIMDTYAALFIGLVYALLPFMIFAVFSSAEKLDRTLLEASRDLGAGRIGAFLTVALPLTMPGLMSGVILTFIPSMGLIFITEILGGNRILLIGNVIYQSATLGHNQPFAAALSLILLLVTTLFLVLYRKLLGVKELEGLV